ncbi:superoxide dismutase family protein [Brasilonema sp. UFV-L1]|uniref:superoxide dismutase family protein n=1 Tax=Brasilonema sp. UFV-L1 TaxID=2234130 RepID=UPI00145F501D|nr:superoxide dismutase family protein [Brasilonema sp. UFV-L1]NMG05449.1 superoxide dismutase family protein [Brasilonema sp. UFV-L1]
MKFSLQKSLFIFGVTLCLALACGFALWEPSMAQSQLKTQVEVTGTNIAGTLTLIEQNNGVVRISGEIQGDPATLTPGEHGLHIHGVGVCEPNAQPAFTTAGGHFDPGPAPFASELPVEANHPFHMGDLPNLVVDEHGYARYNVLTSRVTLSESAVSVFDENGSAIIIHQLQDLQKEGGTGSEAGGPRLACGVITRNHEA